MRREIIGAVEYLDPTFLRVVHAMMLAYQEEVSTEENPVVAHTIDGKPIKEKELFDSMDESVAAAKSGASRLASDVFEEKKQWLSSIK